MPRISISPRGFHADLAAGRMTLLKWLALAPQAEADGVEIPTSFLESMDSGRLRRLRQEAAARDLRISLTGPPDPAAGVPGARRLLQATAEIGGHLLRILPGRLEDFHELLPYAESTSVTMVLHPPPGGVGIDYFAVLDAVRSPWLKAEWDPEGTDPAGALEKVLPRLAAIRLPSAEAAASDSLDEAFRRMAASGFDGWVCLEGEKGTTVEQRLERLRSEVRSIRARLARHFPAGPGRNLHPSR